MSPSPASIDLDAVRKDTKACAQGLAHLNNAGASLMPEPVHNALKNHLALECDLGGYEAKDKAIAALEHFYDAAAASLNASREEIAFIENATRAWDMVFYAFDWQPGDKILTSTTDYDSNMIAYRQVERRYGVEIVLVPNDESGAIDVTALDRMIDDKTKLVSVSHIPTNDGLVAPVEAIGKVTRDHGVPYLLDACQSVGQIPIDVEKIGCDMLSSTGRKYVRGPRGTGMLWVKKDWIEKLEPPFLDNHAATWTGVEEFVMRSDARRFENWECYFAGKIGLGIALDYGREVGQEAAWERIQMLAGRLRAGIGSLKGGRCWDSGNAQCGITVFNKDGVDMESSVAKLRSIGINTSLSVPQLTRDDISGAGVHRMIRASVHYFNTEAEVDRLLNALEDL